jgi:hypothetical protein
MIDIQVEKTKNVLINHLEKWNIDKGSIKVKNSKSDFFKRIIINGKKKSRAFSVIVYAKVEPQDQHTFFNIFLWEISIVFFMENSHKIDLSIRREKTGDKIVKFFGYKEPEVYNSEFDKAFFLESNHPYAYAEIISKNIQEEFLKLKNRTFLTLTAKNKDVRFKLNYHPSKISYLMNDFQSIMDIGFELSSNIENFN